MLISSPISLNVAFDCLTIPCMLHDNFVLALFITSKKVTWFSKSPMRLANYVTMTKSLNFCVCLFGVVDQQSSLTYIGFRWDEKSICYFFYFFFFTFYFYWPNFVKKTKLKTPKFRKISNFEGFQIATRCKKISVTQKKI